MYGAEMPTVWMRKNPFRRARFHASPECRQLRKNPSRGERGELLAVDLDQVQVRPCLTCYPDAPRVVLHKAYCQLCDSVHPCAHNGGVRVYRSHNEAYWVWPDTNQMPYFRTRLVEQP